MKYYAGIGSRETPKHIQLLMTKIAETMETYGYTLRSGGAVGADKAFAKGTSQKEIYLHTDANEKSDEFLKYHPAPHTLIGKAKKLISRNAFQVLGKDLNTPSSMVICWTPDGCDGHMTRTTATGGTGQAITIAEAYDIPIYNLANSMVLGAFDELVSGRQGVYTNMTGLKL